MPLRIADLTVPIVGAPMAGGPSTPALAAAVTEAGGLGFLAGGYLSPQRVADDIAATRVLTTGPIGVNLFVPQPSMATAAELERYRGALLPFAARYGAEPGAFGNDDDGWADKLDVVADTGVEAVSFTFGCPSPEVIARLRQCGVLTLVTVTGRAEARIATAAGADGVVVQGPEAGGHRGVFAPDRRPPEQGLHDLLADIAPSGASMIAAGGMGDATAVAAALAAGAIAAQVGTALLLCDEAGTNPAHRAALVDPRFTDTVVTNCFSGRYARSLVNEFAATYDAVAPPGYPQVHQITGPIRAAAVAAGDPQGTSLWAGVSWRAARTGSAADVVAALAGE